MSFLDRVFVEQTLVWPVKTSASRSANTASAELGADTSFSFSHGVVWLYIDTAYLQQMAAGVCCDVTGECSQS